MICSTTKPADRRSAPNSHELIVLRNFEWGMWFVLREAAPHRRRDIHMDVANKSSVAFQIFSNGFQPFPPQLLFCIEEETEGRNHVEAVTQNLLGYVDLRQSDVVHSGRVSEHERGY